MKYKLGTNYISGINEEVYKVLLKSNYIEILKYPGISGAFEELEKFVNCVLRLDAQIDIHGIPGCRPATHDKDFINNVEWTKLKEYLRPIKDKINVYSTHIGTFNSATEKNLYTIHEKEKSDEIYNNNIKELRKRLNNIAGHDVYIGGEMQSGGFGIDLEVLKPEFISASWESLDFGVIDYAHMSTGAKDLNITLEEYISRLTDKDKVKIMHVSGNELNKTNPDAHTCISKNEMYKILEVIKNFKNIEKILLEFCFEYKYSKEKEMVISIVTLKHMIENQNIHVYDYIEQNLQNDCSNLQEILDNISNINFMGRKKGREV